MNLTCKHLKAETQTHSEFGGGSIKETYYDCTRQDKELGSLKPCIYAREGKISKNALTLRKNNQGATYEIR